jgi:phenylalanyl-tRNA synthetase beta chain
MSYSYNWLKTYFDAEIPVPKEIENGIIFHSFEVEGMEEKPGDTLLDIKILPDRAHDCLCHTGIAGEISAIFDIPKRSFPKDYGNEVKINFANEKPARDLTVKIDCPDLCRRYIGRMVENVKISPSPSWLKDRLENIGQRSISNIVDATNYVMNDLGQPMHAFDADKVKGGIIVRRAKDGEKMTTLDGKELILSTENMVIADEEGPLALAGIKGGNKAEVDANTKNIILESANFEPVNIRRTSQKVGIRTDASKRYENDFSPEEADAAMDRLTALLFELAGGTELKIGGKIDVYPNPTEVRYIETKAEAISAILGIEISKEEQEDILRRLDISILDNGNGWKLGVPSRRVDLNFKEDIVEEIGRIYGYDKIPPRLFDDKLVRTEEKPDEKNYRVANKIRETLVKLGFAEVYGYAFAEKGEIEVANPLATDKPYLRTNLSDWLKEKLAFNLQYVLFDNEPVKIFELGRVFKKNGELRMANYELNKGLEIKEEIHLAIGVCGKAKKFKPEETLGTAEKEIADSLHLAKMTAISREEATGIKGLVSEYSFNEIAREAKDFSDANLDPYISPVKEYKKVSLFPRIIRDVALFVPEDIDPAEVASLIKENAGPMLDQGPFLFDVFPKDGKKSLAFRQVFQSYEKTLSDEEVNKKMNEVVAALEGKGWEVRK